MKQIQDRLASLGVHIPEILLPAENVDMKKWATIACDQFSSERNYWEAVKSYVGDAPSTLKMILPECYLEDGDRESRVAEIQKYMKEYQNNQVLQSAGHCFIYVERKTQYVERRAGLVIAVDLEKYDYKPGTASAIRPTEGTVLERVPPRKEIRSGAILDLPHIMLLINDKEGSILEELGRRTDEMKKVYDFDLQSESGHITGYKVESEELMTLVAEGLEKMAEHQNMLFAVGDGNHSLAAAKAVWEDVKAAGANDSDIMNHPARYALVELENIYDSGLMFEPIHRVLFKVNEDDFFEFLQSRFECEIVEAGSRDELNELLGRDHKDHAVGYVSKSKIALVLIRKPEVELTAEVVQTTLDDFLKDQSGGTIDYIHGEAPVWEMGTREGNFGLFLPAIEKDSFFELIESGGSLPRKTFSIGEPDEKRFYIESRVLTRS